MMRDGEFTQESFDKIFKNVYEDFITKAKPTDNPQAFILGGQPGAGKTGLQEIMSAKVNGNLIVINGDEFRSLHPDFEYLQTKYGKDSVDYTGAFSGKITENLIKKLKEEKYNVLVEGTLRTAQVPLKTCDDFKKSGYDVTLAVIAVKPQISYISTMFRYEKMLEQEKTPRATSKKNHDFVVERIPENMKEIYESQKFNNILIYNREGECLYDMSKRMATTPYDVIDKALNGQWSKQELEQFIQIGSITQQLMKKRNAEELPDFINNVFNKRIIENIKQQHHLSAKQTEAPSSTNKPDLYYLEITSPEQLKSLEKSGIAYKVNPQKTIAAVAKVDKEKALECISKLDKPKLKR